MARGTTLQELCVMFRNEVFTTTSPAVGDSFEESIKHLLRRTQKRLFETYDWPFLKGNFDKVTEAGQRYYDIPEGTSLERTNDVWFKWDGTWHKLLRGITMHDLSIYDSDEGERVDPILKWDTSGAKQFEVWPIPGAAGLIRFEGVMQLPRLTHDSDRAALDDDLIVLFAASEWLTRDPNSAQLAQVKSQNAAAHLARLRGQLTESRVVSLNGELDRPIMPEVRVAYVVR